MSLSIQILHNADGIRWCTVHCEVKELKYYVLASGSYGCVDYTHAIIGSLTFVAWLSSVCLLLQCKS